ncbi:MAG: UDP-N-acetylmuramate--L-alanine ligase [Bacillota bacterium]|nr:UDP-N-acetylmuramate--L-alanine ligase [Bacillota bacterium]
MINIKEHKHFHFIGIGGIGMSALANIMLSKGCEVSGSDIKPSDITDNLKSLGATIFTSHQGSNVDGSDAVIYTAAVSDENPEIVRAKECGIPLYSRADLLGSLMQDQPYSIAISGTHGKTTTTSMVSLILEHAGFDPTILVGGNLPQINGNVKIGSGDYFVTEACEYRDSFLSMRPNVEIILNIDSDHLDYFNDIEHIARSFSKFASLVPEDGLVAAYAANAFVAGVIKNLKCNVVTFGFGTVFDYGADEIKFDSNGYPSFNVYHKNELLTSIHLSVPGEHNVSNALAAFACTHSLGAPVEKIKETLEAFTGTQRRFDSVGNTAKGAKIIDDYAHHPTEIKATLKAATNVPHKKLWCVFQPHTYTRTLALFEEFAAAFSDADAVVLADIYAARERNIYKISSEDLANRIKERCPEKQIEYFDSFEKIADYISENAGEDDLVITMGAGDVYKISLMLKN